MLEMCLERVVERFFLCCLRARSARPLDRFLGCLARFSSRLLALLSQPTMLLNPFLSFRSGMKLAEVTRIVAEPHHFDAPMVPLHDRP